MLGKRWIVIVLGGWIVLSAFLGLGEQASLWSSLVSGIVVAGTGTMLVKESAWQGWTVVLLGFWMVLVAFVPDLRSGSSLYWNNILIGGTIAVLGMVPSGRAGPAEGLSR